jgi:hypothetical protein
VQVLSAHFRAYIQALEKLQLDIATSYDLIGVETRSSSGLFTRAWEPLKNRSAVFALGDRNNILKVWLNLGKSGKPCIFFCFLILTELTEEFMYFLPLVLIVFFSSEA